MGDASAVCRNRKCLTQIAPGEPKIIFQGKELHGSNGCFERELREAGLTIQEVMLIRVPQEKRNERDHPELAAFWQKSALCSGELSLAAVKSKRTVKRTVS